MRFVLLIKVMKVELISKVNLHQPQSVKNLNNIFEIVNSLLSDIVSEYKIISFYLQYKIPKINDQAYSA